MNWFTKLFSRKAPPPFWTGRVLAAKDLQQLLGAGETGFDTTYAEVNADALPDYYAWFTEQLARMNVAQWKEEFDCDNFAWLYTDLAPVYWYLQGWESGRPKAQSPAMAAYAYWTDWLEAGHVIAKVATQRGVLWIEPQTGKEVAVNQRLVVMDRHIY